jgi:LysR family glycine cleavage system transcriptional activator
VDIALRFGLGAWPGVEVATLMIERLFPVCSPDFLVRHPIKEPRDLLDAPLLRHVGLPWSMWLTAMGVDEAPRQQGLGFEDTALMLDTAAHGVGVALARSGLADRDLREGRLVRPFSGEVTVETGNHFVWRADSPKLARILKLRDWFLAETAGLRG